MTAELRLTKHMHRHFCPLSTLEALCSLSLMRYKCMSRHIGSHWEVAMKLLSAKYIDIWYIIYYYDIYLVPSVWVQWLHSLCFLFSRQMNQQRESPLHNHPSLRVYESPNLWPSLSSAAEEMVANSPGVREPTGSTYPPYEVLQDDSSSSFLCFLQLLPRLPGFCKKRTKTRVWESAATPKLGSECVVKCLILTKNDTHSAKLFRSQNWPKSHKKRMNCRQVTPSFCRPVLISQNFCFEKPVDQ